MRKTTQGTTARPQGSRRRLRSLALIGLAGAASLLAGCSSSGANRSGPSTAAQTAPSHSAPARLAADDRLTYPPGGKPAGAYVLVIHGGGWEGGSTAYVSSEAAVAAYFNYYGYAAYNIDYRTGPQSLTDVVAAYDWLRARTRLPICAWGESAGGHLALMLAALRPALTCVISQAGPTDFLSFRSEAADGSSAGPRQVYARDIQRFFASKLAYWSPVTHCPGIHARLLLSASTGDQTIPQQQLYDFKRACPQARVALLDGSAADGPLVYYTHAGITRAAQNAWSYDMLSFLSSSVGQPR
jgi:acetyl esterase/lipase